MKIVLVILLVYMHSSDNSFPSIDILDIAVSLFCSMRLGTPATVVKLEGILIFIISW